MTPTSLWNNVTTRSKTRKQRMSVAFITQNEDEEALLSRQCASYSKRMKTPPKSVAKRAQNANYTVSQRLQALTLYEEDIAANIAAATADVKDSRSIKR